ncbi:MAG: hypothetical protein JW939_08495 [Candidatus Thermoplasmatota archaeon]|nr:hypothetical protein [Candidatus Thermoplasmatota archaeon]
MGTGKERDVKYTIPREEVVIEAVMDILNEAMTIRSQTLFHRLVKAKMREMGLRRFRLSPRRLRMITAKLDNVDLLIYCREGERRSRRSMCPVCGASMIDIRNSTLYGWEVSTGKACKTCSYWTGARERIPTRYVFTLEKERYLGETMEAKG